MTELERGKKISLLKFYKENNVNIRLKLKEQNIIICGRIEKMPIPVIGNSLILKLDQGSRMKIFVDDIMLTSILPQELKEENNPINRKSIPSSLRKELWTNYFGDSYEGKCNVCKNKIMRDQYEAGHIVSVKNGGSDRLGNLVPICQSCNRSMGIQDLEEFKDTYY